MIEGDDECVHALSTAVVAISGSATTANPIVVIADSAQPIRYRPLRDLATISVPSVK